MWLLKFQMRVRLLVQALLLPLLILWLEDLNKPIAVSTNLFFSVYHYEQTFMSSKHCFLLSVIEKRIINLYQTSLPWIGLYFIPYYHAEKSIVRRFLVILILSFLPLPYTGSWIRSVDHLLCSADFILLPFNGQTRERFLWLYEPQLGLHPLLFHLLSQRSKETVEEKKSNKMLRMSFILLNRKDHETSDRRKEVSSRGTWKHFASLLFCCFGRRPKMNYPYNYNRFCEMFVCCITNTSHVTLLVINILEHKRMIETS